MMKNSLRLTAVFVALWFGLLSNTRADAIPYPASGAEDSTQYTFTATTTGEIGAYFYNQSASYTNTLSLLVNGVITPESSAGVLNNHTSSIGDFVSLGFVHAGDVLTFQLNVITTGNTLYSDSTLNADGVNHVYSTSFSGDTAHGIPTGTYVGFEDIYGGGDFDYNDETFVFTNISAVPEPETYAMLLAGLGLIILTVRRSRIA
ncbi:DUF4114 domain-containing protein [Nitrosomonas sp. Nm84]|uniref:DUF4114 domain-containing protein n=1 Tax=Nitrosomonas sp. Nm84 TaxID=200124 RepID=UPI0021ACDD62|nr:DUF4114 domain-containing protein [Nitrosomonas sp. Nm84]